MSQKRPRLKIAQHDLTYPPPPRSEHDTTTEMEQGSNPVTTHPARDRHSSTATTLPANNATIYTNTRDSSSSTKLPPPASSGPECTPMDNSKSLKRPHV